MKISPKKNNLKKSQNEKTYKHVTMSDVNYNMDMKHMSPDN